MAISLHDFAWHLLESGQFDRMLQQLKDQDTEDAKRLHEFLVNWRDRYAREGPTDRGRVDFTLTDVREIQLDRQARRMRYAGLIQALRQELLDERERIDQENRQRIVEQPTDFYDAWEQHIAAFRTDPSQGAPKIDAHLKEIEDYWRAEIGELPWVELALDGTCTAIDDNTNTCTMAVPGQEQPVSGVEFGPRRPSVGKIYNVNFPAKVAPFGVYHSINAGRPWIKPTGRAMYLYYIGGDDKLYRLPWPPVNYTPDSVEQLLGGRSVRKYFIIGISGASSQIWLATYHGHYPYEAVGPSIAGATPNQPIYVISDSGGTGDVYSFTESQLSHGAMQAIDNTENGAGHAIGIKWWIREYSSPYLRFGYMDDLEIYETPPEIRIPDIPLRWTRHSTRDYWGEPLIFVQGFPQAHLNEPIKVPGYDVFDLPGAMSWTVLEGEHGDLFPENAMVSVHALHRPTALPWGIDPVTQITLAQAQQFNSNQPQASQLRLAVLINGQAQDIVVPNPAPVVFSVPTFVGPRADGDLAIAATWGPIATRPGGGIAAGPYAGLWTKDLYTGTLGTGLVRREGIDAVWAADRSVTHMVATKQAADNSQTWYYTEDGGETWHAMPRPPNYDENDWQWGSIYQPMKILEV